jgi:hypothetical protein
MHVIISHMMKIHIIRKKATPGQIKEMMESLDSYIKLAVDVKNEVLAGGGMLHADCEAVLLDAGSKQKDIWGADWIPDSKEVRFEALINIRPNQNNRSMTIKDKKLRLIIEKIVRERFASE